MRRLHLGCGNDIKNGYINIDTRAKEGVDVVRDILRGLPYDDNSVDEIFSANLLEHVAQLEVIWLMNEMHRVMRPGGTMRHLIPEAGSVNFNQDPTHLSHWVFETFTYFTLGHRRNLYYDDAIKPWHIEQLEHTVPNKLIDVTLVKPGA